MKLTAQLAITVSVTALVMVACSAPASEDAPTQDQNATGNEPPKTTTSPTQPAQAGTPATGLPPAPGTTSKPGDAASCTASATLEACWTCCDAKTPAYAAKGLELDKKYQACLCEAARCGDVCKTDYCANPDPEAAATTDACDECLFSDKALACDEAYEKAWDELNASALSNEIDACGAAAKCDDKPSEEIDLEEGEEADEE